MDVDRDHVHPEALALDEIEDPDLVPLAAALERYAAAASPPLPPGLDRRILAAIAREEPPGPVGALIAALRAGSPHAVSHAVADALRNAIAPLRAHGRWSGPGPS